MKNLLLTFLVSLCCLLPLGVAASPPSEPTYSGVSMNWRGGAQWRSAWRPTNRESARAVPIGLVVGIPAVC